MNDELNENELESVLGGVPYEVGKEASEGLDLSHIANMEGLELPTKISEGLDLSHVANMEGLELPKPVVDRSLSEDELEAVIGGVPYETGKEAAELLKDAKRRIIESDANKDGKLVGEEIENANLGDYIKENSKSI